MPPDRERELTQVFPSLYNERSSQSGLIFIGIGGSRILPFK